MKKSCNPNDNHQEGQEQSKKLYRSISESARRLDDAHSCAQNVGDLFSPSVQIQRSRFQEYCERLIFSDPVLFGRKAEELLWRKCYYDVISTAKKLKKKEYTTQDVCNIETHINAGVGHYHHFILRLQYQYQLDVKDVVDFAIFKANLKKSNALPIKLEQLDWAKQSVHRCLIYLGDLNRYKLEVYPNWDPGLSIRCYLKAVHFKPEYGIPHNQLGTLASNQNRILDAIFHYICCLSCKYTFDGTENNLLRLFDKNSRVLEEFPNENRNSDCIIQLEPADHIKRLIARFLFLVEVWYFNKKFSDVYVLCHQTNVDLQECLSYSKPISNESDDIPTDVDSIDTDSISSPVYLSDDMVFKIVVVCLLCISKLQKLQNTQVSTIIAFTLAVYSQLLQIVTDHIHDNLLPHIPVETNFKINGIKDSNWKGNKARNKIRRRRKKRLTSEDSDVSEPEEDETISNSDGSIDGSDDEFVHSSSDNESVDEEDTSVNKEESEKNGKNKRSSENNVSSNNNDSSNKPYKELASNIRKIDPNVILDIITEEKLLLSVKILSDWFISDVDIVKSCGKSTRSLLKQIVQLLNFLNINCDDKLKDIKSVRQQLKNDQTFVLSEDIALKGINIAIESNINWEKAHCKDLTAKEESLIRILKLIDFGNSLVKIGETGISFDSKLQQFVIQEVEIEEINGVDLLLEDSVIVDNGNDDTISTIKTDNNESLGQLSKMKHMGQLWLAAEVRALENRVKSKTSLSPYLVLDVDSLIQSTAIVKHLVNSKKFIAVIPLAVVSALDDLKREKQEARDAIRWLELQFHHGNRFCRAQRPQERTSVPFIKYPKKKDKDLFTYIQIIECCHFFVQQQDATNLVTLLIGENTMSNSENREVSYMGLAHSAGINVEIITGFYEKWRKNFKGKK